MPTGTKYENFEFTEIYCDGGAKLTRGKAIEAINKKYHHADWQYDWVWIYPEMGIGAHKAIAHAEGGLPEPIEFLFAYDPQGPKFTYVAHRTERGDFYPNQDAVMSLSTFLFSKDLI